VRQDTISLLSILLPFFRHKIIQAFLQLTVTIPDSFILCFFFLIFIYTEQTDIKQNKKELKLHNFPQTVKFTYLLS